MGFLKRSWWFLLFVVFPLLVILFGALYAFRIREETSGAATYAAIVATVGICLTAIKTAIEQWEKLRERRKKDDDNREVLAATPEFRTYLIGHRLIGVELYNSGKVPVAVKRVSLVIAGHAPLSMVCTDKRKTVVVNGTPQELPEHLYRVRIEPKDYVRFHIDSLSGLDPKAVLELPAEALHIVVDSFQGEVARVTGNEIQEAIRQVLLRQG